MIMPERPTCVPSDTLTMWFRRALWFSRHAGCSIRRSDRDHAGRDAGPADAEPSSDRQVARSSSSVVVFVFGIVLPRLIDFDAVRAALSALTAGQLALLAAASAVAYIVNAGPYRVLVPGLSWPHAVGSDLAARAVVSTVPGPTDVATRFVLYRQWSIPTDVATAGIVFAALFETFSSLPCR